jgi:hypothetical protein
VSLSDHISLALAWQAALRYNQPTRLSQGLAGLSHIRGTSRAPSNLLVTVRVCYACSPDALPYRGVAASYAILSMARAASLRARATHRARRRSAERPVCGARSERVHSRYVRRVADLPWLEVAVHLQLQVRRFFCDQSTCPRVIFTERLPGVVAPYARRTERLTRLVELVGSLLGGSAGSRLLRHLGSGTLGESRDTVLRGSAELQ